MGIDDNDPLILFLHTFADYQELAADLLNEIKAERQVVAQKSDKLHRDTDRFLEAAETLNCRLKERIPRAVRDSGLLVKELATATLIAFLAGGLFFRPLVSAVVSITCDAFPAICEGEER